MKIVITFIREIRLLLRVKFFSLCIGSGLVLISCQKADPVAIIYLEEAALRITGNITMPGESSLMISNPTGSIIVNGTGDPGNLDYMLHKLVQAQTKKTAEKNLDKIFMIHIQESDTLRIDLSAPENSQTLKYFCGLFLSVSYAADCYITHASGDINISDLISDINIINAQEDIIISRHTGNCDITTENGDIRVSIIIPDSGYCIAGTFEGDIDLYIPAQTSAQLTAVTNDGSVSFSDISFNQVSTNINGINGTLGSGNGDIHLNTGKGDIRIYGF